MAAAGLVLIALVAWLLLRGGGPLESVVVVPWQPASVLPGAASATGLAGDGAAASASGGGRTSPAADESDPCGPGAAPELPEVVAIKESRRLREEILAALKASPDVNDQATAALLLSSSFMSETLTKACEKDPGCVQKWTDRSLSGERKDADAAVQTLAQLAERSQSSYVYQLALLGCRDLVKGSSVTQDACSGLSLERWAALEPQSAAPWMAMVERARLRDDQAAIDNALYQAAQAPSSRGITSELMRRVMARVPADGVHRALRADIGGRAFGAAAYDMMGSSFGTALGVCRESAGPDSNRRQTCRALGDRWLAQSDSILQSKMALALITHSGMGVPPADRDKDEADALSSALSLSIFWRGGELTSGDPLCGMAVAINRHFAGVAKTSEIDVAREVLAAYLQRTGKSVADVAREYRAQGAK